jgi:hypothetical protein
MPGGLFRMTDKPKPGGYIDRAALSRAVRGNRSMAVVLEELIEGDGMSRLRRAQLHQRMGLQPYSHDDRGLCGSGKCIPRGGLRRGGDGGRGWLAQQ